MENSGSLQPSADNSPDKAIVAGGIKFMPVYLGHKNKKPSITYLSQREERILNTFAKTLSIDETAKEVGVKAITIRKYLKRPNVRKVLDHLMEKAAIRQGTDLDETISWLRKARDGTVEPNDIQVKCANTLAKILRPAGAGISVNVQTNVGAVFESPYKDMDADQLKDAMKERMDAIEGGNPGEPGRV